MAEFTRFWSGGREFVEGELISEHVKTSRNYADEDVESAKTLLLFETSRQRTWLVATDKRLYCILDDARKDLPRVQWSFAKDELIDAGGNLIITIVRGADHKKNSGLVHIGPRRNWIYSKRLFPQGDPVEAITQLIQSM